MIENGIPPTFFTGVLAWAAAAVGMAGRPYNLAFTPGLIRPFQIWMLFKHGAKPESQRCSADQFLP